MKIESIMVIIKVRTHRFLAIFLVGAFCVCSYSTAITQDISNIKFKKIGISDGLSSSTVSSVLQDRDGFMWFGTRNGLSRYDGYQIKTYYNELDSDSTLHDNWIYSIYEDDSGFIWISTFSGINLYLKDLDKILRIEDEGGILKGLTVRQINPGSNGEILLSSESGLYAFEYRAEMGSTIKLKQITEYPALCSYVAGTRIWIASLDGIYQYDTVTRLVFKVFDYEGFAMAYNFKVDFYLDKRNTLLVGLPIGLYHWDPVSNSFRLFEYQEARGRKYSIKSAVRCITEDSKDKLWVGSYEGLHLFDFEHAVVAKYAHSPQDIYSLSHNSVYDILEDHSGNVWIGTWAGGVNFFDQNLVAFKHYYSSSSNSSLSYNVVSSIVEEREGEFWVATEGGGLNRFDRNLNTFEKVDYKPLTQPGTNIKKIIKDMNGCLWIGQHSHGLEYYDPKSREYRSYMHDASDPNSLSNNHILALEEDRRGNVWIGTNEGGLNLFLGDGQFKRFDEIPWMANANIYCIFEKRDSTLLLGSDEGLIFFDPVRHKYSQVPIVLDGDENDIFIHCIYSTNDTVFWLGTSRHGLIKYNIVTGESKIYHTGNGLPSNLVYGILPQDQQTLWMSTNQGLAKFDIVSEKFQNYTLGNGLQSNVFNYNSYLRTSQGEMFFGGINGFNLFRPEDIGSSRQNTPIYITSLKVFNQDVDLGDDDRVRTSKIGDANGIVLQANQFNFTLEYVALNYSTPQLTSYEYKLDGFDTDWIDAGSRRLANYNNIEPGQYTFFVRTKDEANENSSNVASLDITMLPPWWKTWWAYLLYLVLFLCSLAAYLKFKTNQDHLKEQLLQARIDTKNEKRLFDLKLQFFTNVSHELRTPLTLMLGPAEELISHNWKSAILKDRVLLIYNQSKKMYHLINQLLDFRKVETGNMKLSAALDDISKFVNEIYLVFKIKAEEKGIQYTFKSIDQEIPVYYDRDKMEIVFTNLLSNAFKQTPELGTIKVDVDYVGSPQQDGVMSMGELIDNYVSIVISDDGLGMTAEQAEKVFNRFHQTLTSQTLSIAGTGIGLSLVKDLIGLQHGHISLTSQPNKGTMFHIKLPFGKAHLSPEEISHSSDSQSYYDYFGESDASLELLELPIINHKTNEPFTILLVDDNQDFLAYLRDLLAIDYTILSAEHGVDALQVMEENVPDLIISDVMMPEMDGITLCKKVKEDSMLSHTPFILLTARTALVYEIEGLTIGATDYVTKPFNPKVLQAKIHNIFVNKMRLYQYYEKAILSEHYDIEVPDEEREFIEKSIRIVEENVGNGEFNVQSLVKAMAMSQSSFYKKLKSLTGKTVVEFIRDVKMRVAAQLLIKASYRVYEVAEKVGIRDPKYFRESFRKVYGVSPSEYVRQNQEKEMADQ